MVVIAGGSVVVCVAVITIGVLVLRRYRLLGILLPGLLIVLYKLSLHGEKRVVSPFLRAVIEEKKCS
jgi:hypothetical protein